MHFPMTVRALGLVDMNPIAALVLRSVAGDVRRAHHGGDTLRLRTYLHDTDTRAHRKRGGSPNETIFLDRLANPVGDACRLLGSAAVEQYTEFIAAEPRDSVG